MTATTTDRDAWLEWRREGVGASDVAGILGISPWASPWSIWADKMGLLPPEPEDEAMSAGRWLEAAIGPWFTHETGLHVAGQQTWCSHPIATLARCTVDGFVFDGPRSVSCVDCGHAWFDHRDRCTWPGCRCSEPRTESEPLDDALGLLEVKVLGFGKRWDEIPAHYQCQGQWQMFVTGLDRVWFAVLMGRRLDIHELERDQIDIDYMRDRVEAFWRDHVIAATPPPVDAHDATLRAIGAVYPIEAAGTSVEVDAEDLRQWQAAKTAVKLLKSDEKRYAAAIEATLGDAEVGTVDGQRAVTWRAQTRKTTCRACGHVEESEPFRVLRPVKTKENA
jgi:putative phage-type endonuclease